MPNKSILKKLDNLIFTPKFGGNIFSDYQLHTAPRYKTQSTKLLGKLIKISDAPSFLSTRKEIFRDKVYNFNSLSNKPVIFDCGANIGISTIYFGVTYPNAEIHAFEPDPQIFNILKYNLSLFNHSSTVVHNSAVWIEDGLLNFDSQGGLSGKITTQNNGEKVESVRLKTELAKFDRIDFLKIDIEGAELEVIKDISDHLEYVDNLFIEYHSTVQKPQELPTILSILSSAGFRYHIKEAYASRSPFNEIVTQNDMDFQLDISASRKFNYS